MRKFEVYIKLYAADDNFEIFDVEADLASVSGDYLYFHLEKDKDDWEKTIACFKDWSHFVDVTGKEEDE